MARGAEGYRAGDGLAVKNRRTDRVWMAAACAVAAIAYLPLASWYVQGGDNAEFASLFATGGVAHPPGYPLYVLVLRAFSWIPARSAAHGAALVTALIAIAAVGMLARACRSWGASAEASAVAATAYAVSGSAWQLATHAEVFALNALVAAAIVDAAGPHARVRGAVRLALLGALAGLGLAHHTTILAMGPIGIVGVARGLRESKARALGYAALAFVAGLTPYAYALWRSHDARGWVWGAPMAVGDLVRHVRRTEYWEIATTDVRGPQPFGAHLAAFGEHLARDLAVVLVPLAVAGLVAAAWRAWRHRDRAQLSDVAALVASFALAGPVFLFMMARGIGNVPIGVLGVAGSIVARFYLLPLLLACVAVALGIDAAARRLHRARPIAIAALGACVVAAAFVGVRPRVVEQGRAIVEAYLVDTLQTLPPNAVVVGTGDHRMFGFFYAQRVLGVRDDVLYVDAHLARADWYRARLGLASAPRDADALVAWLAREPRPLFLTNDVDLASRASLPTYAIGTVVRVLPAGAATPSLDEHEAWNDALAPRLHRASTPPAEKWSWAADADDAYARGWLEVASRARACGDADRAARAIARANAR